MAEWSQRGDGGDDGVVVHVSASDSGGIDVAAEAAQQLTMTKTIVIAMSCVVAYLGVMAALTVYCLIHMIRARRLRNQLQQPDERQSPIDLTTQHCLIVAVLDLTATVLLHGI